MYKTFSITVSADSYSGCNIAQKFADAIQRVNDEGGSNLKIIELSRTETDSSATVETFGAETKIITFVYQIIK